MSEPTDKSSTVPSTATDAEVATHDGDSSADATTVAAPKEFSISQKWVLHDSHNLDDENFREITTVTGTSDDEATVLRDALIKSFADGQVYEQASNVEKLYGFLRSGVSEQVYNRMNEVYKPEVEGQELPYTRQHVADIVGRSYNSHIARAYRDIIREEEAIRSKFSSSNLQGEMPLPSAISQSISAAKTEGNTQATDNQTNWDLFARRRRNVMHNRLMKGNIDMKFKEGDTGGSIVMSTGEGGGWSGAPTRSRASFTPSSVGEVEFEAVGQFSVPFPVASGLPHAPIKL